MNHFICEHQLGSPCDVLRRIGASTTIAVAAVLSMVPAAVVSAQPQAGKNWVGSSGNWSVGSNWNNGTVPAANDIVNITHNDGIARAVTYNVTAPTLTSLSIDLTGPGNGSTTFSMSGNSLTLVDGFVVGRNGRATFNHSGGAVTATNPNLDSVVGFNPGGNGIYNLSGTGALSVARDLYVGTLALSRGRFNQSGNTSTTASRLILGSIAGSEGVFHLSAGSLTSSTNQIVGNSGVGRFFQSGGTNQVGSSFPPPELQLGFNTGAFGEYVISGGMLSAGIIRVGNSGLGSLRIVNGGKASTLGSGHIATNAGSAGTAVVSGVGSLWELGQIVGAGTVFVGNRGNGELLIDSGGRVASDGANIGTFAGARGSVVVAGSGSTWTNRQHINLGWQGEGFLTIENGGRVSSIGAVFADAPGSRGTATVLGAGSTWAANDHTIGREGIGVMTIASGGAVVNQQDSVIGSLPGSQGTVTVTGSGSSWSVGRQLSLGGRASPNENGGSALLEIQQGAAVNVGQDVVLFPDALLHLNGGTISTDAVSFRQGGEFRWSSGTLNVGTWHSNLANPAGTLAPGRSIGTTSIQGTYNQGIAATLEIEIGGLGFGTGHDFVNVASQVTLGGKLDLLLRDSFVPNSNDTFAVLSAGSTVQGMFNNAVNGQRLATADGIGSFLVHYGPGSVFNPSLLVLSAFELSPPAGIPGDFNANGAVNNADLTLLLNNWGASVPPAPAGWTGTPLTAPAVNNDELTALLNNWGALAGTGSAAAAVPEPAAMALLAIALTTFATATLRPPRKFRTRNKQ